MHDEVDVLDADLADVQTRANALYRQYAGRLHPQESFLLACRDDLPIDYERC